MKPPVESEEEPLIVLGDRLEFLGKPTQCLGHVHLHNRSLEKVRIKQIPLVDSRLTGPAEVSVSHLRVSARLPPGTSLRTSARLLIPSHTPPGKYTAAALVGNVRKPVAVDVLESWDLAVIPADLSVKLHPGERLLRTVQITNRGNMPWDIPKAAVASLEEKDGIRQNMFLSLTKAEKPNYESVLNDFVKRMRDSEVQPAKIKILSEAEVLLPEETQEVKLEISFPDNLKKNRRYSGSVHFENAVVQLDIEVLGNSERTRSRSHEKIRRPTPTSR